MKRGFYAKGVKTRCHKPGLKGVEKSDLLSELERAVKDLEVNPPCPRSLPHKDSRSTSFEGFFLFSPFIEPILSPNNTLFVSPPRVSLLKKGEDLRVYYSICWKHDKILCNR